MKLTRKEFLRVGALAGATVTLIITGCGSDDDGDGTGGSGGSGGGTGGAGGAGGGTGGSAGSTGGCTTTIGANHAHAFDVPAADLDSTTDKTYSIQGGSPHDHMITLTAADLATLKGGGSVTVTSTETNAHSHPVTITCA